MWALILSTVVTPALAGSFRGSVIVNDTIAEKSLLQELGSNARRERVKELEKAMMTTFHALPKTADGHLGHQAVRYILHRLFIEQRGWFIRGLESSASVPTQYLKTNWVPSYLQHMLEKRFGENGISLHELAALAAALEDLIAQEALGRFEALDEYVHLPKTVSYEKFSEIVKTFMVIYLKNENLPATDVWELNYYVNRFMHKYAGWNQTSEYIEEIIKSDVQVNEEGLVDVEQNKGIFNDIGLKFHALNDRQCRELKATLVEREDRPGRVLLGKFYNMSKYSHWQFREKPEYLKTVGALDESEPGVQRLIIPNYVQSMSNCLNSSSLYSMCCRNECEELMASLEKHVANPVGYVVDILEVTSSLSTESVSAPRKLPDSLQMRLQEIASLHNGKVPLHSRLFAQWMHHAFPKECPYPHTFGSTSSQSPEEYTRASGSSTWESEEAMDEFIVTSCKADSESTASGELPWHAQEENPLDVEVHRPSLPADSSDEPPSMALAHLAMCSLVFIAVVYVLQPDHSSASDTLPQHGVDDTSVRQRPKHEKVVHALILVALCVVANPVLVASVVIPGFFVMKVVPMARSRLAVYRKLHCPTD